MNIRITFVAVFWGCSSTPKSYSEDSSPTGDNAASEDSSPSTVLDSGHGGDSGHDGDISHCATGTNPSTLGAMTCMNQSACVWTGNQNNGHRGYAIDLGGDVNGDGWTDMVVGAPAEDTIVEDIIARTDSGAAHLWFNAGTGRETAPSASIRGSISGIQIGYSVAIAPDINGDGLDDIIIGGQGNNATGVLAGGTALLVLGRPDWDSDVTADHEWNGNSAYSRVGKKVKGSQDLNGDGLGDLLIATDQNQATSSGYETPASGRVAIIYGSSVLAELSDITEPDVTILGSGPTDGTGMAFTTGDVNGDGRIDVVVGSPYGRENRGRVDIFRGQAAAMSGSYASDLAHTTLIGASGSGFGYTLAVGDLNNDGIDEITVGAPLDDWQYDEAGSVAVYSGGIELFEGAPEPAVRFHGEFDDTQLGHGLHAGADLNGDGTGDLVMGSLFTWHGLVTKGGRVYGMHGPHTDWSETNSAAIAPIQVFGGTTKDYLGRSNWAGDINGDGKAELFMGTGYTNGTGTYDAGSVAMFWGQ